MHEKQGDHDDLPRFAGWWGNDPKIRFRMHLEPNFVPRGGAEGWQISNPPILAMAPVRASYDLFDEAGMEALRAKSIRLTGYLEYLVDRNETVRCKIISPRDTDHRSSSLSLLVHVYSNLLLSTLQHEAVMSDLLEPLSIRLDL